MSDDDLKTLADASRIYGTGYGPLYYAALKRGMKPARIMHDRKFYTDAQIQQLIADLAGQAASMQSAPEVQL